MAASWAALAESTACCTGASSRHFAVAGRRGNPAVRDLCEGPPSAQVDKLEGTISSLQTTIHDHSARIRELEAGRSQGSVQS